MPPSRVEPVKQACAAKLTRGQYKRIPKAAALLPVGFYIACPDCGFVRPVTTKHVRPNGVDVEERGGYLIALRPPYKCGKCGRRIEVREGRYV